MSESGNSYTALDRAPSENSFLTGIALIPRGLPQWILITFLLSLCLPACIYATGGAFPYVKHGGGTVDGITFNGVDRSVNPDYGGSYYNDVNTEAGRYTPGECTQCHEPHASFGGSEPPPINNAANPYLLMRYGTSVTNYAELCWYCHENMTLNNNAFGYGYWGFYQGQSVFQSSSHYLDNNFYWPGTTGDPASIWPRQNRSGLPFGNKGSCINCHTPHGIKAADAANAFDTASPDGTGGVPASMQTVASGNPSVNADYLIPRQLIAWEETLCERCHDAGGPSTKNIQTEINKRSPSPSSAARSGHPIDDTSLAGKHVASEPLPVTTKHVECYDCHNPHAVKAPTGVLGDGDGGRIKGMKYININGTVQDPATGAPQPYVYQVCLKCHGNSFNTFIPDKTATGTGAEAGGTLRTTVAQYGCTPNINPASSCTDGSNKRLEFDTAANSVDGFGGALAGNRAYHPVAAAGRNASAALTAQLLGGLTAAKTINCTDCHNNEITGAGTFNAVSPYATPTYPGPVTQSNLRATDVNNGYSLSPVGPHGSTNVRVLRANYNTSLGTTGAAPFTQFDGANFALCFNCHNVNAFTDADGIVSGVQMTNFRQSCAMGCCSPKTNLHAAHLTNVSGMGGWDFLNNMYTACANCHYNVHSNAEATNTQYGTATGAGLPADGDTHLINFSPIIQPYTYTKPRWWYTGSVMRCNLTCHGVTMEQGFGPSNADAWYTYYAS